VAEDPVVVVPDARSDARFAANPFVTGELDSIRMYASAPLVTPDGHTVGRLCVFDQEPGDLTAEQQESLAALARRVMDVLQLRLVTRRLEDSLRELTETRDELRRSNEHLSQLAGQISHDLRTPLTAVLANAELLAGEPAVQADAAVAATVEDITRAGEHMRDLITQVLEHARVGGSLDLSEVSLDEVVERALADVAPLLERAGGRVEVGPMPTVTCDRTLVYSVVLNLLTNAVKFTRPGVPPLVQVSAEPTPTGWRVRVRDNGRGLAPGCHDTLFTPFLRGDSSVEGHGIGLATARRVVVAHGGRIGVEDNADVGTTFWFELPR
jgi:signal transduction histidine kinase